MGALRWSAPASAELQGGTPNKAHLGNHPGSLHKRAPPRVRQSRLWRRRPGQSACRAVRRATPWARPRHAAGTPAGAGADCCQVWDAGVNRCTQRPPGVLTRTHLRAHQPHRALQSRIPDHLEQAEARGGLGGSSALTAPGRARRHTPPLQTHVTSVLDVAPQTLAGLSARPPAHRSGGGTARRVRQQPTPPAPACLREGLRWVWARVRGRTPMSACANPMVCLACDIAWCPVLVKPEWQRPSSNGAPGVQLVKRTRARHRFHHIRSDPGH